VSWKAHHFIPANETILLGKAILLSTSCNANVGKMTRGLGPLSRRTPRQNIYYAVAWKKFDASFTAG